MAGTGTGAAAVGTGAAAVGIGPAGAAVLDETDTTTEETNIATTEEIEGTISGVLAPSDISSVARSHVFQPLRATMENLVNVRLLSPTTWMFTLTYFHDTGHSNCIWDSKHAAGR